MQQLDSHFKTISSSLREEMDRAGATSDVLQAIKEKFSELLGPNGSFGGKLTAREQRLVSYFFNPFLIALFLLSKVEIKTEQQKVENIDTHHNTAHEKGEPIAIAATAASTIVAAITPTVIPAIALGLVAGGATTLLVRQLIGQRNANDSMSQEDRITTNLSINPNEIQAALETAVLNFDKLSVEIESIRNEALNENLRRPTILEDIPNVLPFFHEMLGLEQELAELKDSVPDCIVEIRQCIKIISKILNSNGINLISYQPGVNDELFDRQSALGTHIEAPHQIKPALVRGEIILINGVVLHP